MSVKQFDTFLEQQIVTGPRPAIDWDAKKADWLRYLDHFYAKIKAFLQPYIEQGKIRLEFDTHMIDEDFIGHYTAPSARILLGSHQLRLEPVGTNLIAAKGRVDLIGPCGTVKFVLVDCDAAAPRIQVTIRAGDEEKPADLAASTPPPAYDWKIATPAPGIRYLPLTAESFYDAIMQVTRG